MGTGGFSSGVMRPGRETDHSPPTSAEVKKTWIYTSAPPYAFMSYAYLVEHRDNFTFYQVLNTRKSMPEDFVVFKRGILCVVCK
jgi:hypothetical protein